MYAQAYTPAMAPRHIVGEVVRLNCALEFLFPALPQAQEAGILKSCSSGVFATDIARAHMFFSQTFFSCYLKPAYVSLQHTAHRYILEPIRLTYPNQQTPTRACIKAFRHGSLRKNCGNSADGHCAQIARVVQQFGAFEALSKKVVGAHHQPICKSAVRLLRVALSLASNNVSGLLKSASTCFSICCTGTAATASCSYQVKQRLCLKKINRCDAKSCILSKP